MEIQKLTKAQMATILAEIERVCSNSIQDANTASKKYSDDTQSQLSFEVGYLGGTIKTVLAIVENYKK
jgi:MFS-type transporter involved in bile tolerance (Atg22 family)